MRKVRKLAWGRYAGKKLAAAVLCGAMLMGISATVCAEEMANDMVIFSSTSEEMSMEELMGYLALFEGSYQSQEAPYREIVAADGSIIKDKRVRSVTGAEGQQPIFSVPSSQKDICYKGLRQTLDAIPLYPDATTGYPELDVMLDQIFAQIITPEMDTHDKLKACYDYLIYNISDPRYEEGVSFGMVSSPVNDIFTTYYDAAMLYVSGAGVCDNFSAAFAVMAWKLGVPMYVAGGQTSSSRGGYTPHAWCQLDGADGTTYVFDPHIDYTMSVRSGKVAYQRFGATQAQMAGKYIVEEIYDKVI